MQPELARRPTSPSPTQRRLFALHPFLAELEPAERQRVLWCSPVVDGRPGRVLLDAGDPCVGLLLLTHGSVRVVSPAGTLLDRLKPGDVDATSCASLLIGEPSPARLVVGRDVSGVLLPAGWFASLLTTSTSFRCAVLDAVGTALVTRTARA